MPSTVRAHKLYDYRDPQPAPADPAPLTYYQLQEHEPAATQRVAFTSLLFSPPDGLIYCGLTSMTNDILHTFDPGTGRFASLGYAKTPGAERHDVKIHRSFAQADDGTIYAATACLHPLELRLDAPGGKVFSVDPQTQAITVLGIPVPYDYIQTIALDRARQIVYVNTYPVWQMAAFDLRTRQSTYLGYGHLGHRAFCDQDGNVWAYYDDTYRLFKYNPDDGFTRFKARLPMFNGKPEPWGMAIPAPDERAIYMGTASGHLYRLDPDSGESAYLGKPLADLRIEGLIFAPDGLLYGAGGWNETGLFAYDRASRRFHDLGRIFDPDINDGCVIPHDICMTPDGTIWTGETDHPHRACYLWECRVTR